MTLATRALRGVGYVLVLGGLVVALYLVYELFWTNVQTGQAQQQLAEEWTLDVGDVGDGGIDPGLAAEPIASADGAVPVLDPGDAVAVLQFARPGSAEPLVVDGPLYVVEGTGLEGLKAGPGHYAGTAMPGQAGNFAVAGHRTTYAAPFFHLDQVREGDEVLATDRSGTRYTYRVVSTRVVAPSDTSVIGPDPLGTGAAMLTLTTCDPRFSNAERLIVFAELVA